MLIPTIRRICLVVLALCLTLRVTTAAASTRPYQDTPAPTCIASVLTGICELAAGHKKDWTPPSKGKPASTTRVATKASCRFKGQEVPCSTAEGFWDRSTGCYLKRVPEPHTLADVSKLPKNAAFYRC